MSENIALTYIKNLKDVFDLAADGADGFDKFFSEAEEKSLGNYSWRASK